MVKIGVISDTHIRNTGVCLPYFVCEIFQGVDIILHAGDLLIEEVIIELEAIAPTYAVAGNNDHFSLFSKYGKRKIIEAGNKRIGLTHGSGRFKTHISAFTEFNKDNVDCIVFGHSHIPYNKIVDGVLLFNPGSPTDKRFQSMYSLGVLYIDKHIKGDIYYFKDKNNPT